MKKVILIIGLVIMFTLLAAQQVPRDKVIVEIGTGGWCQYCPGAAMGADDLVANGHEVAIIENHNGDPYATVFSDYRNSYYGITGYPTAWFDGGLAVVGGSGSSSMYSSYLPRVNQRLAINSSFTIDLEVDGAGTGMEASITVEKVAGYTGTNLVLHFVVTESEIPYSWFGMTEFNFVSRAMVPDHFGTTLDFTSGNTQVFTLPFTFGADWVLEHCEFIAFIQDNTTKEILQGTKTEFTGLLPMFASNVTEGPAYLGVQFTSNSLPNTGIDSWEWDFDGDGTFDSTEENPFHMYTTPGTYDVTLRIEVDGEYAEATVTDYITVTEGSAVSGNLSGTWVPAFSPYTISGDITIAEGDELVINSDVELQ
ncbi:MAG: Omp28-related outer membrane protein, partial [Candidatus Cloacimonetes bacterium]|nr:Omp28-related outer membrane protein [Candidatus Cloacimonadota bacterium]